MASRSDRVLITGGAGFTGRPLAERLRQEGHFVAAVGRRAGCSGERTTDLLDLKRLTQTLSEVSPTAIVHLAGVAAPTHGDLREMYSANVIGTANLFGAMDSLNLKPRIIVVASSAQVYATGGSTPIEEQHRLDVRSHYAISKLAAEQIAAIYSSKFPIIIARPFNYTGPGQSASFVVPKIVQHYAERQTEIRLGNLDLFRDFSDLSRTVEAYARLLSRSIDPTTVNICSGRAVHLLDILTIMDEISGHHLRVISDPSLVRADEPRYIIGSSTRLQRLIGDLPNPPFRETLVRMYEAAASPQS